MPANNEPLTLGMLVGCIYMASGYVRLKGSARIVHINEIISLINKLAS